MSLCRVHEAARVVALCGMLAVGQTTSAFTFSDGGTMQCYVDGAPIEERAAPTSVLHGRIALTERAGPSYRIL
ncbi:MAG TPA: hypothetical protein VFR50_10150, partial [Casimicrobiaceae bacterium]|nr:hypothetical protein [Casimicrobiaceae bacterium]